MKVKPGTRVIATSHFDDETGVLYLFGFGTYEGDEVPPPEINPQLREAAHATDRPNPKIKLDSGKIVWGCECWWGPVVDVDIDEARKEKEPT